MEGHEYVYRIKPLIIPGIVYLVLYPCVVGILSYLLNLPAIYLKIFSGIYLISGVLVLLIWLTGKRKSIIIERNIIVFRSIFGQRVIEPKDIRKASFFWTAKNEEIVQIKAGKEIYYLTNLYFPFNELLTDLEEFIVTNNVRSNLSTH